MRRFVRPEVIAATILLAVCALSRPASADTETVVNCANCNGYTFQASLTPNGGGNYSLSYTIRIRIARQVRMHMHSAGHLRCFRMAVRLRTPVLSVSLSQDSEDS